MKNLVSRVLSRFYYGCTGVSVIDLQSKYRDLSGTVLALEVLSKRTQEANIRDLKNIYGDPSQDLNCQELGALFAQYGSDKSTKHNYHLVYASLLKGKRNLALNVLEIGLGTNNTNFVSNMGVDGKPGASLRAFRDWGKNFHVYGADIDSGVLFSEERIQTYFVDQTKPESLAALVQHFPEEKFDLIIDDGLHTTWANLNTLNCMLELLKPGAYFVVEDILDRYLPAWQIALSLLPKEYTAQLVKTREEIMCVIQKV